ncbi:unnamed protein product [Caenorhabditis angaria]|uniref:Nucleolar protein,Nop52 containing protein n=1 Tax=Caenorhabditis angaria TaxID=860376 RepID=A0A9P1IPG9_9PELO|nr:unnamed protein product [Caenorhabditis angaria]
MDVDLASVEVVFAQKLACGEPTTRQRALRVLHDWIRDQSSKKPFTEEDLTRLCKGLHYVMWMQDKMVLQEELADRIGGLINIFTSEQEKVLYVKSFLKSLNKEWPHIDRWRMDKFLMEVRRMLRAAFAHLKDLKWKKEIRDEYWSVFEETTISADNSFNEGLKMHFASLLLDELDAAGGLTKKQTNSCLQPYVNLLGVKKISDYLFNSIIDEIFNAIVLQKSEEIKGTEDESMEVVEGGIQFNYKDLAKSLFEIGKQANIPARRRARIYDLVQKFEKCVAGQDPLHFEIPVPQNVLTREDYEESERKIVELQEVAKAERLKAKKMKIEIREKQRKEELRQKRLAAAENDSNDEEDENEDEIQVVKKKGTKKSKQQVPKVKKARASNKFKKINPKKSKKN